MMLLRGVMLLMVSVTIAFGQNTADRFYQSIRNNDLAALRMLIKQHGAVGVDSRGQAPLMVAAAFGSYEAMRQRQKC